MKVLHVIPSFYPAHVYGGPIYSVYQLCRHLASNECEVRVLTTDANGPRSVLDVEKARDVEIENGLRVRYCKRLFPHTVSGALLRWLPSYVRWADVVHLTAVYSFPTIPTLAVCKFGDKPVVWSPRGSLQRWEGSTRVGIKAVWELVCAAMAPKRTTLHVTSEEEARQSRERFSSINTSIIPNGIEIPQPESAPGNGNLRLTYLGRLHQIKGIENLLLACKILEERGAVPYSLVIAGRGDSAYTEKIQEQISKLALSQRVSMVGEVSGDAKLKLFENSDIVVVPSHSENFGIVVAESLAHGVPVIASKGTPWQGIEAVGCGLWVDSNPSDIAAAVERLSEMPLRRMGQLGRQWMEADFTWHSVAKKMIGLYHGLMANQAAGSGT